MDTHSAWESLSLAIADMNRPGGDHELKLATVVAGVELLFTFPSDEILQEIRSSTLPVRAIVSWLVFEGHRLPQVAPESVAALREAYEATCPPGEGLIPPPSSSGRAADARTLPDRRRPYGPLN